MNPFRALFFIAAALCAWSAAAFAGEKTPNAWEALAKRTDLQCALKSNGRDAIIAVISNQSAAAVNVEIPAGLVCELADRSGKVIALRAAPMTIEAGGSTEATIPAAALSAKNGATAQPCTATRETAPKLALLLTYLATRPDVPRSTTQLVVLSLLEDASFSQWQNFLISPQAIPDPTTHPTPAEVVQAVDALAILREVAPDQPRGLASDAELKLRAVRNPWTRAKAAQLYGLAVPESDGSAAVPNLGQLLHRVPNDNCPICRARDRMQQAQDGF